MVHVAPYSVSDSNPGPQSHAKNIHMQSQYLQVSQTKEQNQKQK